MNPFWSITAFWLTAVVLVVLALVLVLRPLLRNNTAAARTGQRELNIAVYRDQLRELRADLDQGLLSEAQFAAAQAELEARLAEDALSAQDTRSGEPPPAVPQRGRRAGYALAAVLPVAAFGLYFVLGSPISLTTAVAAQAQEQPAAHAVPGGHDIMKMIAQVEEKTRKNPDDAEAWTILAKTYAAVRHWPEALHAYEQAYRLRPEVPAIMTGYAEALAITRGRVLDGKPIELVMAALEKEPENLKGLELAGIHAFQNQGYAKAAFYMRRLHALLPPESPFAQDILAAQKEAEKLMRQGLTGLDNLADASATPEPPRATIQGVVELAPALQARVGAEHTVMLYARASEAGPPAAALRAPAGKLPLPFMLHDGMAMNPAMALSNFKTVTLTARISKNGQPTAAAGDLEGVVRDVQVGASGIKVVIDRVRP